MAKEMYALYEVDCDGGKDILCLFEESELQKYEELCKGTDLEFEKYPVLKTSDYTKIYVASVSLVTSRNEKGYGLSINADCRLVTNVEFERDKTEYIYQKPYSMSSDDIDILTKFIDDKGKEILAEVAKYVEDGIEITAHPSFNEFNDMLFRRMHERDSGSPVPIIDLGMPLLKARIKEIAES